MKRSWVHSIQIALLLVMISGLITGCAGVSSLPTPPASEYPADIIGRVTIANKVIVDGKEYKSLGSNIVYWIVEVSVRNKEYQNITSYRETWTIVANSSILATAIFDTPFTIVPQGQSGVITIAFSFRADDDTKVSDTQICYQGREPFSYGELIAGDTVAVYDWDLKKVTQAQVSQRTIATVTNMWVGSTYSFMGLIPLPDQGYSLFVELEPTRYALAETVYEVELYEKGNLRASTSIAWNQPEINVSSTKSVYFSITEEEYNAYYQKDVSHIFSVKVHE